MLLCFHVILHCNTVVLTIFVVLRCTFSFPSDEVQRQQWAVKVRRLDDHGRLWQPTSSSVLCSEHFQHDDFTYQFGRKTVTPGALPTIFSFAPAVPKRKAPSCRSRIDDQPTSAVSESQTSEDGWDTSTSTVSGTVSASVSGADSGANALTFHSYSLQSPRKLKNSNEILRRKLGIKVRALRNARKREVRLRGKVGHLLEDLRRQQLLTDQAYELLQAYNDLPVDLLRSRPKGCSYTLQQR